ncbi:M61 family metallopeptidase [Ideonella sp. A 288]|uniref:M61 family metallopeptidase n=1 Tax=Ideonella sp. A 288 TaxID=1962181 RepID=UPI000B4BC803|nr:PDZ domain-containing protein [Ideonella sp. A 288]
MVRYRVEIEDAHAHLFRVTLTLPRPAALQRLSLPVWIPGSYLVREFSRHLSGLQARQGGQALAVEQIDKAGWQVACSGRAALVLSYRVYAFDRSVRTAFLDAGRGFFNGTSLLLRAEGREHEPHELALGALPAGWDVATAMPPAGRRRYRAADYAELVDHPFELGPFWRGSFQAGGVAHELVVAGALPSFDGERLLQDTRRLCEQHIRFWHASSHTAPPFQRYLFLLLAVDDGYGGLEHRASSALVAARRDLPRQRMEGLPDGYVMLLGLLSHEYFHAWNVKRLRPADFEPIDYDRENYTRLLWFFEGVTSYYDDLMLLRAGLIDLERYLRLVARAANAVATTPGRRVQSLAEASFDAWIKYYRSDENTPNATVSYYQKGALVALALDLRLRREGGSLDEAMRLLWQRSGGGGPIATADIVAVLQAVGGRSFAPELAAWVDGTDEVPLAELLADLGVEARTDRAAFTASLGLRLSEGAVGGVHVKAVLTGSAAAAAGISAGDELLAVDGWRIRRLDEALLWIDPAKPFDLLLVRDQRVMTLRVAPQPASPLGTTLALLVGARPGRAETALRRAWLDG